jgi:hypothetical protein
MSGLDLIPDAETALQIGKIILNRYYGESIVADYEPYSAVLRGDEWGIGGTPPGLDDYPPGTRLFGGGQPALSISKKDARVTHIALTR